MPNCYGHLLKNVVKMYTIENNEDLFLILEDKLKRIHPTQKPTELYEWLLMNYAKEGDKILAYTFR